MKKKPDTFKKDLLARLNRLEERQGKFETAVLARLKKTQDQILGTVQLTRATFDEVFNQLSKLNRGKSILNKFLSKEQEAELVKKRAERASLLKKDVLPWWSVK